MSPTTWLKTDDKFPEHKKVRRLTDSAYRLHHTAMCACAKDETDGLVTEEDIADMEHGERLRKHVDALVLARFWEVAPGGWMIHDFLHYNPSHEEQNATRAKNRERQARSRDAKKATPVTDVSRRDSRVSHAFVTPPVTAPRPDPSRPVPINGGYVGGEGHVRNAAGDPPRCFKHRDDPNPPACGQCAEARKRHEFVEAEHVVAERREKANRRIAIDSCEWCDDNGIRHEPGEVRDFDLPAIRCTHEPMALDEWRKLAPIEVEANA